MKNFHHKFTLPLILTMLVLAIAILVIGFINYRGQTTQPSNSDSTAIGIELNQNLDYIDLHKLETNGISFVYLRSTQGRSYFDNNYLLYRDQVSGTKLAFGSIITYSNESTPRQQYDYFQKKVGANSGSLTILVVPASEDYNSSSSSLKQMGQLVKLLEANNKQVIVATNYQNHAFYPAATKFLATGKKEPNSLHYAFWQYTNNGRVKNVNGLEKGVTMFSYNGTVAQYKQKYGQLTQ